MKQKGKRIGALLLALMLTLAAYPVTAQAKAHTLGNSLTNQMLGSRTCEYGGRIYYGYDDRIYSVKKDGTGKKTVFAMQDAKGLNGFSQIVVYDGFIYALFDFYGGSDTCNLQLLRVELDGSDYSNYGGAASFSIADDRIYYTKAVMRTTEDGFSYMDYDGIYVMEPDGTNAKALVKKGGCCLWAADGEHLYYACYNAKTYQTDFYRCDRKGKNRTRLLKGMESLALSGNYLYYSKENYKPLENGGSEWSTDIYRKNRKDNSVKKIYTCRGSISNFYVDGRNLYVSSYNKGLVRVSASTGKSKVLNKHTGAGIGGVHGSVMVFEQHRMDMENGTDIDMILAKVSTGKKLKKIGAYFVS